jgi:hypothetical protein
VLRSRLEFRARREVQSATLRTESTRAVAPGTQ